MFLRNLKQQNTAILHHQFVSPGCKHFWSDFRKICVSS